MTVRRHGGAPEKRLQRLADARTRADEGGAAAEEAVATSTQDGAEASSSGVSAAAAPESRTGAGVQPDLHGGKIREAAAAQGIDPCKFLEYSANVNFLGPTPAVAAAARRAIDEMAWYPVDPPRHLGRAAAAFFGVDEESVLLGNGASELIFLVVASLRPGRVLVVGPTFTEYERAALAWGAAVDVLPLPAGRDFVLTATDLEDAGAAALVARADLLFYCDPNNPTGALLDRGARRHLLDLAEAAGTAVFADESFLAFTSAWPAGSVLREHRPNVIVLHSLTKILAMPGLRLGALIVPPAYRAELRRRLTPWNINCVAHAAGHAALAETEMLASTPAAVRVAREAFVAGLAALPEVERVLPADANFVCVRLTHPRAREVVRRLREEHGVLLRDLTDFPGLDGHYVRSAVRAPEDNRRVLRALAAVLADGDSDGDGDSGAAP